MVVAKIMFLARLSTSSFFDLSFHIFYSKWTAFLNSPVERMADDWLGLSSKIRGGQHLVSERLKTWDGNSERLQRASLLICKVRGKNSSSALFSAQIPFLKASIHKYPEGLTNYATILGVDEQERAFHSSVTGIFAGPVEVSSRPCLIVHFDVHASSNASSQSRAPIAVWAKIMIGL